MKKRIRSKSNRIGFVLAPVAISIIICSVLYVAIAPIALPLLDIAALFIGESKQTDYQQPSMFYELAKNIENSGDDENATINLSEFTFPEVGTHYGEIEIGGTTIKADLFWGDSPKELNAGVGTYSGAWLPGFGRTVMFAGHTMTFFKGLGNAKVDDIITVNTYYGEYTYKITDTVVKNHQDTTAYDFTREDENIVLYTCYPFDSVGLTPSRYFVYGEYISGPQIVDDN